MANKNQLLQTYKNLYENYKSNGKLSKREHNQAVWIIKNLYQIELNNQNYINSMLNKVKHVIQVKTKTRANNDFNTQLKLLKAQCGYTYDVFNFVTLNSTSKKQVKQQKIKKQKASKSKVKVTKKAELPTITLSQAFSKAKKLDTIRQAAN